MITAVDFFAGMGGNTEGAKRAGIKVVWAGNHWREAVDTHAVNHPEVEHVCQDLQQADMTAVPPHDLLLASPSCQGHSPARGKDRPHHDAARSTAWAVVSCAEIHRPRVVVCENVVAWTSWVLWPAWCSAMHALGYAVSPHVLDAADFGVPQHRTRLIVVCTRSKHPLELNFQRRPHVAASIDWSAPGWRPVQGLAQSTLNRIYRGRCEIGSRFLMSYYGSGSGLTGRSLARPIGTITTRDRWALVECSGTRGGARMRMINVEETRAAMGFPSGYRLPRSRTLAKHMLGNAVCPPLMTDVLTEIKRAA